MYRQRQPPCRYLASIPLPQVADRKFAVTGVAGC